MTTLIAEVLLQSESKFINPQSNLSKEMEDVARYIDDYIGKSFSVSELARRFGYSLTYFTKKFRKAFGCTPSEYIANIKIEKAQSLLQDQKLSVADVASALGFSNTSYFSNFFKLKTGLNPAYYRKKAKSE
jgi:AraC-like DNA-binding protein